MNKSKHFAGRMLRVLCVCVALLLISAVPVSASASTKYIKTTAADVNIRKSPSTSADTLGKAAKGAVLKSSGSTTKNDTKWYKVTYKGNTGYIMAKYCKSSTETEYNYYTNKSSSSSKSSSGSSSSSSSSSSSKSVEKGTLAVTKKEKVILRASGNAKGTQVAVIHSKGEVCTLQGKTNKADGYTWYSVKVDGKSGWIRGDLLRILSKSEAAAYQKQTGSSGGKTLYKPELADWKKDGVNKVFYKGCVATLTDVKTGISLKIKRWSGGLHVDAEPLTAADTARLCRCYGVSTAQEIADKNLYQRRPLLVTIGTRTFACSLYGVPHNYPEGDTISTNEFRGQLCIHFTNSRTHNSNKVDSGHEEAIEYAWEHAPNGHQ